MKKEKKISSKKASTPKQQKIAEVMHEFKEGELHSGSKDGPIVTNPKQAIAIALSEADDLENGKVWIAAAETKWLEKSGGQNPLKKWGGSEKPNE